MARLLDGSRVFGGLSVDYQINVGSIGSTSNSFITVSNNSGGALYIQNSGANIFVVNTSGIYGVLTPLLGNIIANSTTLFVGNTTINATISTSSVIFNPVSAANTAVTGGASVTVSTLFMGNATINTTHNTSSISLNPVAAATTTGTGGAIVNTKAHFVGNNTVNATMNTAGIYIGGKVTAAATGYTVLPNGITMNWGSISANSLGVVGTFSSAFTTLYSVVISSTSATVTVAATASNTTTVTATTNSAASTTVYYQAIGV